jgi:hypothetical protein
MRNLVLPVVVTAWGSGIVLSRLLGEAGTGSGAYGVGQNVAFAFGLVMVVAGVRALLRHFRRHA